MVLPVPWLICCAANFFRATDICCRYGGEEFAIILTESTSRDAAIRADALRSEVKGLRLQYKKQPLGPLTLSVGIAAFPEHGSTSEDLLKIADQCLYESKNRGRDYCDCGSSTKSPSCPGALYRRRCRQTTDAAILRKYDPLLSFASCEGRGNSATVCSLNLVLNMFHANMLFTLSLFQCLQRSSA